MEKINAVITGVGGYVPDYVLTNDEISRMVDTNDEWIMTRIGVKERRILNEEGLGSSYMARKAAKQLMQRTGADPDMDAILRTDGKGLPFLHMKAGGSVCPPSYFTVDNHMHYIYQEGRTVFKYAVSNMSDVSAAIAEKNGLTKDSIDWVIPHQANLRIIDAVAHRLEVPREKVLINIERYGNTSAATLPLCIWDFEDKLKKGDNLIFTAFGAGFTWGAVYVKWGYDGKKQ